MNQGQTKLYSLEKTWMLRSWKKDSRHVYYDAKKLNTVLWSISLLPIDARWSYECACIPCRPSRYI